MAVISQESVHVRDGKTVASTIADSLDYIINPEKTRDCELVSSYLCDRATADLEFYLVRKQYLMKTGRMIKNEVPIYHIIQSFPPGEITPEEANRLAYDLAMRWTKGRHQFLVATHTDQPHMHSHIIFNAVNQNGLSKFRNFFWSSLALRKLNDTICIENGYSIIEKPGIGKLSYREWLEQRKKETRAGQLREDIDTVLEGNPKTVAAFIEQMQAAGYEVKQGKDFSFRLQGKQKFIRSREHLGTGYTTADILSRISGEPQLLPAENEKGNAPQLLIDLERNFKSKESPAYKSWAQKFNAKQMAQTVLFLREQSLMDYDGLCEKSEQSAREFQSIQDRLKPVEQRLKEIKSMQQHISNYIRTREIFAGYKASHYSREYLAEHGEAIEQHRKAKSAFNELGLKKLPTMKSLTEEYAALLAEKKRLYKFYHERKSDMKKYAIARANVETLLPELCHTKRNQKSHEK